MRFLTKFAIAIIGWNFLPPADAPAQIVPAGQTFQCTPTAVWDGDGPVWCAEGPKVRIAGVAAREMDGTCRTHQPCPPVDAIDARDRLVRILGGARGTLPDGHITVHTATMTCLSDGSAGGFRTAAWCTSRAIPDLSCAVVRAGGAVRWPRYCMTINAEGDQYERPPMSDHPESLPTAQRPLKTVGQTVWIEGDSLIIKYGIMYYGFLGQKSVPVQNIKTVSWKDPGSLLTGFLEISILGETPPSPFASPNVQHQNRFIYDRKDLERWRALKTWIDANIGSRESAAAPSTADELRKLGDLYKEGLLTEDEFNAQKAKLLG